MDVADFLLEMFEFAASADDIVEQVPDLGLKEILLEALAVGDLGLEDEFIVVVAQLHSTKTTSAMPLEPHMPTTLKLCLRGRRITYLLSESFIWFMAFSQSLYIFSVSTERLRNIMYDSSSYSCISAEGSFAFRRTCPSLS
jgi:hypothetical protein